MAKLKNKKDKDILDKVIEVLNKVNKVRKPYRLASAGVVAAVLGTLLKATALTQNFPEPYDTLGNFVLFIAILLIVADIARGGLLD